MTDAIGRGDYELRAPLDPLKKDLAEAKSAVARSGAEAEAELAAKSSRWGPALQAGAEKGVKVVAATAAGMFAIATKGAFELQGAMDRYQSETGATAEEARAAGRTINKVAGETRLSLDEVGDAAAKIRTDLGAVGPVADDLTGRFARYARVTKQEAGGAVMAFDDILDSWNLKAEDSGRIMDMLVRSHQLYGGVVADDQAALSALAPVMRAANLGLEDGVSLINLMKSSGVDSAAAVTGLRTALTKIKSPEELQRLVADISATEDPLLRAQKAADLFGDRAGPKLANALAGKALDDFALSAEDVAGATDKANDVLDQSFPAWLKKKASEFGAQLRQLGTDWGPAVTGAAAFVSAMTAVIGPEATRQLTRGLSGAVKGGWNAVAGSGPVRAVIRAAGLKATAVYLAATMGGEVLQGRVADAWTSVKNSPRVASAQNAAGNFMGSGLGKVVSVAFAAAAVVGVIETWNQVQDQLRSQSSQITAGIATQINQGTTAELEKSREALLTGIKRLTFTDPFTAVVGADARNQMIKDLNALEAELDKRGAEIPKVFVNGIEKSAGLLSRGGGPLAGAAGDAGAATGTAFVTEAQRTMSRQALAAATERAIDGIIDAVRSSKADLIAVWRDALTERNRAADIKDQLLINRAEQRAAERILVDEKSSKAERAQARIDLRALKAEHQLLLVEQTNYGTRAEQIAATKALLTSKALLRGLKDKDPEVRQHWEDVQAKAKAKLEALQRAAGTWGEKTGNNFANSLQGTAWKAGLAAEAIAAAVSDNLRVQSPAKKGPLSKGGGPEGFGRRFIDLYSRGFADGVPRLNALFGGLATPGLAAAAVGAVQAPLAMVAAASSGGSSVSHSSTVQLGDIHVHGVGSDVSPAAAKRFGQGIRDEVTAMLREQARRSGSLSPVRR